jgi:hypothetical protein
MPLSLSVALSLAGLQSSLAADYCACKYNGQDLPDDLVNNKPTEEPGKYKDTKHAYKYGTMCGVWDTITGTPGKILYDQTDSYVHYPWCYVDSSCATKQVSHLWGNDTDFYYSYAACGAPQTCFTDGTACEYDPTGTGSNREYKADCPCQWYGQELPADVYNNHPENAPYKDLRDIALYGTTCVNWDTGPHMPWSDSCTGVEFCSKSSNWCQIPWCYVDENCTSGHPTQVFKGAEAHVYSYDTCMGVPDCYTSTFDSSLTMPSTCPFHAGTYKATVDSTTPGDKDAMVWAVSKRCTEGWVDDGSVRAVLAAGTLALVMMVMG